MLSKPCTGGRMGTLSVNSMPPTWLTSHGETAVYRATFGVPRGPGQSRRHWQLPRWRTHPAEMESISSWHERTVTQRWVAVRLGGASVVASSALAHSSSTMPIHTGLWARASRRGQEQAGEGTERSSLDGRRAQALNHPADHEAVRRRQ